MRVHLSVSHAVPPSPCDRRQEWTLPSLSESGKNIAVWGPDSVHCSDSRVVCRPGAL